VRFTFVSNLPGRPEPGPILPIKDGRPRPLTGSLCFLFAVVTLHPRPASSLDFAERIPGHAARLDSSCWLRLMARRTPRDSTDGPIAVLRGTDQESVSEPAEAVDSVRDREMKARER